MQVELGDLSNKEGQAARLYFKELYGSYFIRGDEEIINYSLNYCYQVVRSKIAQSIVAKGMLPSFGFFHRNEYNYFNLADDIIEVFRPIVDDYVLNVTNDYHKEYLTPKLKLKLVDIININVAVEKRKIRFSDAIDTFVSEISKCIMTENTKIEKFPMVYHEE